MEDFILGNMLKAFLEEEIRFVGQAVIGLSYRDDHRPHEQSIKIWESPVEPEWITPRHASWQRHALHNAANILHIQEKLELTPDTQKKYKVAWVGGCVLYDVRKLRTTGGFTFWKNVPLEHAGEDVFAQHEGHAALRRLRPYSFRRFHQEAVTTVTNRKFDIPKELDW